MSQHEETVLVVDTWRQPRPIWHVEKGHWDIEWSRPFQYSQGETSNLPLIIYNIESIP